MSFRNIFDSGTGEADSAQRSAQQLHDDTPGAGDGRWDEEDDTVSGDASAFVRKMESERDPWIVRQTAHGAFDVMGFLHPHFQKFQEASAEQLRISEDPASTSGMASSARDEAFRSVRADIAEEDMPSIGVETQRKLQEAHIQAMGAVLLTTGLGNAYDVALDPAQNKAYVASRSGKKLYGVDLATGAKHEVTTSEPLGDPCGVALDGAGHAYVTDYSGARVLKVKLPGGLTEAIVSGPKAYGIGVDGAARRAYVTDYDSGELIMVDLEGRRADTITRGLGPSTSGVALDGEGNAYTGHAAGAGDIYKINLGSPTTPEVVATLAGYSCDIALDGTGKAYVSDHNSDRMYEVHLSDGAERDVVKASTAPGTGAFSPLGVAWDSGSRMLYISTWEGQLWRIPQRALQSPGTVQVRS